MESISKEEELGASVILVIWEVKVGGIKVKTQSHVIRL
jgi:hypothetical protein